jgi:putative hydrolase of the HAD superfamily
MRWGVIYRVGDDVADLLVPFIREKGGLEDIAQIEAAYTSASLGRIDAAEFWRSVGISQDYEDEYLKRLQLSDGVTEFLDVALTRFDRVACLSNDLSVWSRKLRSRLGLEPYFTNWYISSDLGVRKPDAEIYRKMLSDLAVSPAEVLFVDARLKNLYPAAELGIQTIYYDPNRSGDNGGHGTVSHLRTLLEF